MPKNSEEHIGYGFTPGKKKRAPKLSTGAGCIYLIASLCPPAKHVPHGEQVCNQWGITYMSAQQAAGKAGTGEFRASLQTAARHVLPGTTQWLHVWTLWGLSSLLQFIRTWETNP
jgi:hypothetical protein